MKKIIHMILLLVITGCSDDNTNELIFNLPAVTQNGSNTFGYIVNNKVFIPRDSDATGFGVDKGAKFKAGYPNPTDYYEIDIHDYKSFRTSQILIHLENVYNLGTGNYNIDESNGSSDVNGLNHNYLHCRIFDKNTKSYKYYRSYENSGNLEISKYNFGDRIISGVFNCQAINSSNNLDTIKITEGRFDFKWDTLPSTVYP
jgi:hypothetical protein